jgi:hypothetical protein
MLSLTRKGCILNVMARLGMLSTLSRSRVVHLFLALLFLWSLLPLQAANGRTDLGRPEQREYVDQGQACSLPVVVDQRGRHSADQQLNAFARPPQEEFEAFERTLTADRAIAVRAFTPLPAQVVLAQYMSSDL